MARLNTTKETLVPIAGFSGGIIENVDKSLISASQSHSAQNVNIDNGVFKVCNGASVKTSLSGSTGNGKIMTYYRDSIPYLIWCNGNQLIEVDTTTWQGKTMGIGFDNHNWDSVNNNVNSSDVAILTNGTDNVKLWDGTTLRDLKRDGATSADSTSNKAPKGRFIELHYERLWIADDQNLYASSVTRNGFDVDDWTTPTDETEYNEHGVEIFAYSNDGTKIKGMRIIFGDIVIFKERSIFKIFGTSPSNYQKVDLFTKGSISDGSIAVSEKGAFFINQEGIYVYDGTNVGLISKEIENTWRTLNQGYLEYSKGVIYGDKYILAVPEGSSTINNLVIEYDMTNKSFMFKRGLRVDSFSYVAGKLYVLSNDKILEYNSGLTWAGASINAYWNTNYTDFEYPNAVKELSDLYITVNSPEAGANLKITSISDNKTKEKTVSLKAGEFVYRISMNNRGRFLSFKLENLNGKYLEIKKFYATIELDLD